MPKRDYREKHRKKTKYSSDSSDDYRESTSRSRREKSRSKKSSARNSRKRDSSSSKSRSSSSSSRSRSSSSDSSDSRSKSRTNHSSRSSSHKEPEQAKKFDLEELYKEKDKSKVLEDIESNSFKQATFKQSSSSKIIVDLEKDKIMLPAASAAIQEDESLIHPNFLGDNEKRVDKWIKKLYIYRNQ